MLDGVCGKPAVQYVAIPQGQVHRDELIAGKQRAHLSMHASGVETEKVTR